MKQVSAPISRTGVVAGRHSRARAGAARSPRGDKDTVDPDEVLVVDDDRNIREMIGDFLSIEGYHVVLAENGERALELIRSGPLPAVILLDLMMPVMSGFEFLEVAEQDAQLRRLPVVVVSALPAPLTPPNVEGGVKGWLGKPLDFERLLNLVSDFTGAARRRIKGTTDNGRA
jgi:two-component system, OmpR family, response regulator CpxR